VGRNFTGFSLQLCLATYAKAQNGEAILCF
jgi:hypothetical protein